MSEPAERNSTSLILIGCAATFVLVLGCLAAPDPQPPVAPSTLPPSPFQPPAPAPSQVSGGGLTLTSTSVEFPDDDAQYGQGPGADVMNRNCTACHSANMVLNQPALSPAQWKATVEKMRDAYKAPVDEKDVPAIVAYLIALNAKLARGPSPSSAKTAPGATSVSG